MGIKPIRFQNPFTQPEKRKPVRQSDRKHLLDYQKGKCFKCKKSFKQMRVRPILHHKNLNPKDNRITNLILICPNCHDKIHQKQKKVRVRTTNIYGLPEYKVVKKTVRKKFTKKKKTKKRKTKRRRSKTDQFGLPIIELPKPPKFNF